MSQTGREERRERTTWQELWSASQPTTTWQGKNRGLDKYPNFFLLLPSHHHWQLPLAKLNMRTRDTVPIGQPLRHRAEWRSGESNLEKLVGLPAASTARGTGSIPGWGFQQVVQRSQKKSVCVGGSTGGLVVRIPSFHCHGPASVPGRRTEIPQVTQYSQQQK